MVELFQKNCTVKECWSDTAIRLNVEVIDIGDNMCNNEGDQIDLSRYVNLKNVTIGNKCFEHQDVLNLTGLHTLERLVIGNSSFTKYKNRKGNDSNRRFDLKDCENLKELRIGLYSFSDYPVCEIDKVDSLEVIEMGDLNEESHIFHYASLELKSMLRKMK